MGWVVIASKRVFELIVLDQFTRPVLNTNSQTIEIWRISKDLKGFYSISTASFVVWIDFSAHSYLETLQDRRLGFPKRPYFWKFMEMATHGAPLKSGLSVSVWLRCVVLVLQAPADQYLGEPKPYHSTVRHVSPSSWIFKSKDVLESQDAALYVMRWFYHNFLSI